MFKNNRQLKTIGIILIIFSFVLVYMFYSNIKQVYAKYNLGDDAIVVNINLKEFKEESATNGSINYVIYASENESVKYMVPTFAQSEFKLSDFKEGVNVGDSLTLKIMFEDTTNKINYLIGVETIDTTYLDYNKVTSIYNEQMVKVKRSAYITLGAAIVCLALGVTMLIIRVFNLKKEQENAKNAIDEYVNNPTSACPSTYFKKDSIYNNSKISVFSEDEFVAEANKDITKIEYVKMAYHFTDLDLPKSESIKEVSVLKEEELVSLVNECYGKEKYKVSDLYNLKSKAVYEPKLWLGYYEGEELVGLLIGDLDRRIKEASIEQIVVKPNYRRQGLATHLIYFFLNEVKPDARVATVFARSDASIDPTSLFRHCGYDGEYHWYFVNKADRDKVIKRK